MILVIDNYDSFTYNLVQYIGEFHGDISVVRNDQITLDAIRALRPEAIVISPGPGYPKEAGITLKVIHTLYHDYPIFGVCLGLQSIGEAFGGRIVQAGQVVHGKNTTIYHDGKTIFEGLKNPFKGGRYHSLIIDRKTLPDVLEVSAETADGLIMAVRHKQYLLEGVQFHPESILTEYGKEMIANFLRRVKQEDER
ncbi:MAG: aminodeoxychorismate/anthranilate synthase component II [Calditrichaeota bacterium]|nr:aminodeoxychorismate/anthranilate synthase component II [Calditrichota bacterium]